MGQILQLTSPPEEHKQHHPIQLKDWILDNPPTTAIITLIAYQETWWVMQWNDKGSVVQAHTYTPEPHTATPRAMGQRFHHATHLTNHPFAHWLALKTAMHWAVQALRTDHTIPHLRLTLMRNISAYLRRHGMQDTQRWASWPTDTDDTIRARTTNLEATSVKAKGMHQPRQGT